MPTVHDVLQTLEAIAPTRHAFAFDKVGLQVGDSGQSVSKAVVSFDRSLASVRFAAAQGANLLVAHHPLIFNPIDSVRTGSHVGRTITELIKNDISFVAAHTNWDSARDGLNDELADRIGLKDVKEFGEAADVEAFKLVVTVPAAHETAVIDAAASAGAGVIGAYRRCAFTNSGEGTFEPQPGAQPAVGTVGEREAVAEVRIEMRVHSKLHRAVDRAVRKAHPYEEPAIDWYPLVPVLEQPAGRMGSIAPTSLSEFTASIEKKLATKCWAWGDPSHMIKKVAVMGGAADDAWQDARNAGADVLITGEVKQHVALEASESGFRIIAAGHYATEQPGCVRLRDRLAELLPDIDWLLFEPKSGEAGRPI